MSLSHQLYQKTQLKQIKNLDEKLPAVKYQELISSSVDNLPASGSISSSVFDLEHRHRFSMLGTTTSTHITISAQVSNDNIIFFDYPAIFTTKVGSNFYSEHTCGFKYIKFQIDNDQATARTVSMQISSKK